MLKSIVFLAALAIGIGLVSVIVWSRIAAMSSRSNTVRFVIPAGFRGVIVLRPDKGASPPAIVRGTFVYSIPKSGILSSADVVIFNDWHQETACFDDGTELAIGVGGTPKPPYDESKLRLNDLGQDSNGVFRWFVGTEAEYAEALKSAPWELPVGHVDR